MAGYLANHLTTRDNGQENKVKFFTRNTVAVKPAKRDPTVSPLTSTPMFATAGERTFSLATLN